MIKDIVFILMVLSMTVYAHTNKSEIMSFLETHESQSISHLQETKEIRK